VASSPLSRRPTLAPIAVLAASLLLTAASTALFFVTARSRDTSRFENQIQLTLDRISSHLDSDITLLRGAAGFFAASETVTLGEFRIYVERLGLKRHDPGVQGLGFSQRIPASEKEAFLQQQRSQGPSPFRIWPEEPRAEYHAVVYLEPQNLRNVAALGYDMFTEPTRRAAMERAWRTGEPSLSGKVILKQEIEAHKQAGFLLYAPVYQGGLVPTTEAERLATLEGFVYSPFRADDLFTGIFPATYPLRVFFRIYDGPEALPEQLLHDSAVGRRVSEAPRLTRTVPLEVAGRTWTFVFTSSPAFEQASLTPWVPVLGIVGLLLSGMVFAVAWFQLTARQRAEANEAERAQLLEREQRSARQLQTITDTLPALVGYVDAGQRYRFANRAYETWFGVKPEDVVRMTVRELIGEEAYSSYQEPISRALMGEVVRYEGTFTRKDGHTLHTQSSYIPDTDEHGQVRGFVVLALDITERKRAEEAARNAVRLRDEFLSVASHELKTPLTPLSLKLQTLAREAEAQPESPFVLKVRAHVEAGRKQIKRLSDLIGDLLDVSRISSGQMKLHWEPVDIAAVVREVGTRLEPEATRAESSLTLEIRGVLTLSSDRMRLEQVAENLMTNAIKYGAGKPIHVRLEASPERVSLSVKDQGIGIAPEHQARIFERFERAVSERNYGGLGLGLYITRTIVQALGGTIRVDSQPGQGACFTVELPCKPPAP
jgi:PAS domain S-box-containing protein